jgi:hypothetical protein
MVDMVNLEVQATHLVFLLIPLPLPPVIALALHQQEIAFRITPGTVTVTVTVTVIAIVTTTGTGTETRVTTTAMIAGIATVETAETAETTTAVAIDRRPHHHMIPTIEIIIGHGIGTEIEIVKGKRIGNGNEKEIVVNGSGIWLGESETADSIETGIAIRLTEPAVVIGHRPDLMGIGRKVADRRTVR